MGLNSIQRALDHSAPSNTTPLGANLKLIERARSNRGNTVTQIPHANANGGQTVSTSQTLGTYVQHAESHYQKTLEYHQYKHCIIPCLPPSPLAHAALASKTWQGRYTDRSGSSAPVRQLARRVPFALKEKTRDSVDAMLKAGVVSESDVSGLVLWF